MKDMEGHSNPAASRHGGANPKKLDEVPLLGLHSSSSQNPSHWQ